MSVLELRRLDGTLLKAFEEVPEGTLVHREIMGEHYLKLPFSVKKPFYLRVGDYVNTDYGKFEITKPYKPKYNTRTSGYDYELQLDAYYMKWRNKKVRYMPEYGAKEVTFKLTANIDTHLNVVLRTINALGTKDANFRYNGQAYVVQLLNFPEDKRDVAKYYLYDKADILAALDGLAELYSCEWWVEDNIIYFGKCEIGSNIVRLDIDLNVDEMSRSDADTEYANRLYAFGSTRNLPSNYEQVSADVTVDGVVEKRLTLPVSLCPNGYLQDVQVRNETEAVEGVLVNEDIYPKVECVVGRVETYDSEVENDDGTTTTQTFYRLYDSSGFQFSEDMILEGESLHILFQSGSMNGMDFECHYDGEGKYYEVVVNDDYGRTLPDAILHPVVGMKFVLYNWDATKIESTGIIDVAKRQLYDYTFEYLKESKIDPSTYDCTMKSVWVYNDGQRFRTFDIGTKVDLYNDAFFEQSRQSRIIGFEIKLDKQYDTPKYTVGEKAAYSRRKDMERQIESVTVNGRSYAPYSGSGIGGTGGGTSIYVIKRYDGAIPSDYNVFSAKRAQDEFLSRKNNDTALGKITFKKGFDSEMLSKLIGGAYFGTFIEGLKGGKIDENGDAELNSLIVRLKAVINELKVQGKSEFGDSLMSDDFTSGFVGGKGWAIIKEKVQNALGVTENKYTGEFDNLVVRGALRIFTLVVSQLLGENDNRIFTAMLEVDHYDPATGRVWFDTRNGKLYNPFRVGDYIMVQQYNGMPNSSNDYYVTKHYECVITGAGLGEMSDGENRLDWVTIKNFMSSDGKLPNDVIKKGDTFCRVDNETDADRKGIIQIMTVGSQTPYMDIHYGLKTNPRDAHKGRIGNLKGINHYLFGQLEDFGAYLINLYAVGDFRVKRTGESVDAQIEMLKNQFATKFQQTRYEMTEDDNFLTNATFTQDMDGWTIGTDQTSMLSIGGMPLVVNGATSIYGMSYARIENYEGAKMLRLRKSQITQANSLIRKPGTHKEYDTPSGETKDTYKEVRDKLYLSIRYYVVSEGKMTLGFKQTAADIADEPAEEVAKFMPYMNQQTKDVTGRWVTEQFEGTWNGKGEFILSFSGEVYVSLLSLTAEPLDEFKRTVSTQIIQDAENVKILGQNIETNKAAITNLGIELRAADQQIELYINKKIGDVTSLIDAANTAITNLQNATDALRNLTDDVFKDGIVDNAERIAIEKYLNDLKTAHKQMEGAYEDISDNVYLNKTENASQKQNLDDAWTAMDAYYDTLVNTILSVIDDGLASETEIAQVNTAFDNYNDSVKTFHVRLKEAEEAIEDWIKNYVDSEAIRLGLLIDGVDERVTIYANKLTSDYYTAAQIDVKIGEINLSVSQLDADFQEKINDLNGDIDAINTAIENVNQAVSDLEDYVDGAFYDGVIENAEKVGIEKYLNDLATAYNLMDATYAKVINNTYLNENTTATNTAKSNLETAKTSLDTYYGTLVNTINSVIADGKATDTEKTQVNTAFANYNSAVTTFNQRVEEAQKAIEDWLKNYVDAEAARLQSAAETLAANAALGEYYEQASNPWNSWSGGTEIKHIGAKWKATASGATFYTYNASGSRVAASAENGKVYRYIGDSSNRNTWEEIDAAGQAISFISVKKDHISSVVANFDENGNVLAASGIATTAYGNTMWARKEAPNGNLMLGSGTGVNWSFSQDYAGASYAFNELYAQHTIYNYFPSSSDFTQDYHNATLATPVMKLVSGKRYVLSFNLQKSANPTLHIQFRRGYSASNLGISNSESVTSSNIIDDIDAAIQAGTVSSLADAFSKRYLVRYKEFDDGSNYRYYYVFTAGYPYYALNFVNQVLRGGSGGSIILRKIQLEEAVNSDINDIRPSEYKATQTAIESLIKQTAESIVISANRIHLEGYVTANNGFSIDEYGSLTATGATINGIITSISGQIGGFRIDNYGLTNISDKSYFSNDAYIILRNDSRKCFVGIGPNVTPVYSSVKALGRFEIEDSSESFWGGYNAALLLHAKNGGYNSFAFCGSGNGVLNGFIAGYKFSKYTISGSNTIYSGYITFKENNTWIVKASAVSSGIALPKLNDVRTALGIGSNTDFCIRLTIHADFRSAYTFKIYGRNRKESNGSKPWSDENYPLMVHWNNENWDEMDMGQGDTVEFLLVYDSSRTDSYDSYSTKYTARIINRQD